MDKCTTCKYNTNDYVCHPHCGGCDGQSKFTPQTLKFYKTIAVDFDGTLCENKFPDIRKCKNEGKKTRDSFTPQRETKNLHI